MIYDIVQKRSIVVGPNWDHNYMLYETQLVLEAKLRHESNAIKDLNQQTNQKKCWKCMDEVAIRFPLLNI